MSVTYLFFFLGISCNAYCTALHFTSTPQDMRSENKPHFFIKTDDIKGFESLPNYFPVMNEGNRKMKNWLVNIQKPKKESYNNQKLLKAFRKDSVASETKILGSVYSEVSHKIPGEKNELNEKNSEFNLDYSLPKVHPPSNN